MKPWDDEALDLDEDELEDLWKQVQAEEFAFVFVAGEEGCEPALWVTPVAYFEAEDCLFDGHALLDHLLPEKLDLVGECLYEYEGNPLDLRTELLRRGFIEHEEIQKFVKKQGTKLDARVYGTSEKSKKR